MVKFINYDKNIYRQIETRVEKLNLLENIEIIILSQAN